MNTNESQSSVKKRSLTKSNGNESRIQGNTSIRKNDEYEAPQTYGTKEIERSVSNHSRRPANKEKSAPKEKHEIKEKPTETSPLITREVKEIARPPSTKRRQNCCLHCLQSLSGLIVTLYLIAAAGLSMLVLIGGTILTRDLQAIKGSVNYLYSNLNEPLIADISLTKNGTCIQEGYTPLVLGNWAGTVEGCYCPNSVDTLSQGTCSSQMKGISKYPSFLQIRASMTSSQANSAATESNSCQPVYATPPQNLQSWGQDMFCVKYINVSKQVEFQNECSSGFRSCGINLCIDSTVPCPITSMSIEDSVPAANNNSKVVNLTSGYLQLNSNPDEQPVVQFGVSFNGNPCLSEDLQPTANSTDYYVLLREAPQGCNKYGSDDGVVVLDQLDAQTEYNDNRISFSGNYSESLSNMDAFLYYRQRFQIANSSECSQFDTNEFSSTDLGIQRLVNIVMGCATFVLLLSIVSGMVAGLLATKKRGLNLFQLGTGTNLLLFLGTGILVSTIIGFCYGQEYYSSLQQQSSIFNTIQTEQCFQDQQIQPILQDFSEIPARANLLYQILKISLAVSVGTYAGVLFAYTLNICQKN